MTYRNNKEFIDSQKKGVPELTIFLNDIKHCIINDDELSAQLINTIAKCYPDKVVRVEKGGEK